MGRGLSAKVGDTFVNKNGYHNTKTENGWELTHRLVAGEKLGRPLTSKERVVFIDGDKTNLKPSNIKVVTVRTSSLRRRLAIVEERIREYQAERDEILKNLKKLEK